jgi:sensor histidine kinase regulating citrate/malate metabolism
VRRLSLATQLLVLQLVVVLLVLVAVAFVSYAQSQSSFRREQERRVLSVGETVASTALLRGDLAGAAPHTQVPVIAESSRAVSGVDEVAVLLPDGTVLASADPDRLGRRMSLAPHEEAFRGRSWVGRSKFRGAGAVTAYVPVLDDRAGHEGDVIGVVVTATREPSLVETLRDDTPGLLVYLGLASVLGVAGSLLLARRVKRQTLGMEPRAIASLVEHRDAMLQGVKEGVVGLDRDERVTLVNDEARLLLGLPEDVVGRGIEDLELPAPLVDALTGRVQGQDEVVVLGTRMLILNRRPILSRGRELGSVTTLRDRTELVTLQTELDTTRATTDTLRAQAHEFDNRLHTIAGLVQLGEYDEVVKYVHGVQVARDQFSSTVTSLVEDAAIAALLVAKSSVATEQRVALTVSDRTRLGRVSGELESDLVTVVGNLIDNALEAASGTAQAKVAVEIQETTDRVTVVVSDSGPGVHPAVEQEIFVRGFSTKSGGERGFGLALTKLVCTRRGGDVALDNDEGAVFTATLPKLPSDAVR